MKKFKAKKLLVLLLAMGMLLTACSSGGTSTPGDSADAPSSDSSAPAASDTGDSSSGEAAPADDDYMEISIMNWDMGDSFSDDPNEPDRMRDFIQDKFKIKIVPVNVGWDNADEQASVWAAAGTLPDVIGAKAMPGTAEYFQWINDGVVRPLPKDLSAYPNVEKFVNQPDVLAYSVNGENYFMPRSTGEDISWSMARGILNRKDWRESLGLPIPVTEDDFINMWKAFADNDMNGDGSISHGMSMEGPWFMYQQTFATYGLTNSRWVKNPDGSVVIAHFEKEALPLMSFLRKAYNAGGIDPDFVTDSEADAAEKFVTGRLGTALINLSPANISRTRDQWIVYQPDKDFMSCIEILRPPETGNTPVRFTEKSYWSETYINSSVDDAKMAKILELFDYLYSDDGIRLLQYGFEGDDYIIENGEIVITTDINPETGEQYYVWDLYRLAYGGFYMLATWPDIVEYNNPAIPQEIRDMCTAEREYRINNWEDPQIDYRLQGIDIPELAGMAGIRAEDEWIMIVTDTSSATDEELFDAMYANIEANGYAAAKEAMTRAVAELGY